MSDFYCEHVLNGSQPVDIVHEDGRVVAYHHTRPFFAGAHVVVVPKRHVASLLDPAADDVLPALLAVVRDVASQVLAEHGAARVLTNLGEYQDSKHLHWHVYAGDAIADPVDRPPSATARAVSPRVPARGERPFHGSMIGALAAGAVVVALAILFGSSDRSTDDTATAAIETASVVGDEPGLPATSRREVCEAARALENQIAVDEFFPAVTHRIVAFRGIVRRGSESDLDGELTVAIADLYSVATLVQNKDADVAELARPLARMSDECENG